MLSGPGALFSFRHLMTVFISFIVNSPERSGSVLSEVRRSLTSAVVSLVKALSVSRKLPFLISCAAIELAVTQHGDGLLDWLVNLLMFCPARAGKSINSTISFHLVLVLSLLRSWVAAAALPSLFVMQSSGVIDLHILCHSRGCTWNIVPRQCVSSKP